MPSDIPNRIRYLLRTKYDEFSPREVNDGLCERFATDVIARHPSAQRYSTDTVLRPSHAELYPFHVWVYCDGRHYDAEAPEGVTSFRDLPFWRRAVAPVDDEHLFNQEGER